jgi:hypothetical protein
MERRQRIGSLLRLAPDPPRQRVELRELDPPSSYRQVPATDPSTRNVGTECGVLVLNTFGR